MFPALTNVVKAVTVPARQLGLTFLLFLFFIYAFSLLGFMEYPDFTGMDYMATRDISLLESTFAVMHQGLLVGEGAVLGPDFRDYDYTNNKQDLGLGFFDLMFWIIVTIVLLNCVFGIMVDTFAKLREQEEAQNDALNNYCFICCTNRVEFATSREFTEHCNEEHNLLHYVFLVQYVTSLPAMERGGFENYVLRCLKNGVESWMPIGECSRLQLEDGEDGSSDEDDNDEPIALLMKAVMEMKAEIRSLKNAQQDPSTLGSSAPAADVPAVTIPSRR